MGNRNKKIFYQFVSTYFIIIALVLVCLLPLFSSLERTEREKAAQSIEEYARSAMREMENTETLLFNTARNFYDDRQLRRLYYDSTRAAGTTLFYNMTQLQDNLKLYVQNIEQIYDVFVYIPKFDYVLTPKYIFQTRGEFYYFYKFSSFDDQDRLNLFWNQNSNITVMADTITDSLGTSQETTDVVNYLFCFPMTGDANIPVLVIFSLDASKLAQSFLLPDVQSQASAVITDNLGNVLASTPEEAMISSLHHSISFTDSQQKQIHISISDTYYNEIRRNALLLILRSIGLALLVSAGAALLFAWHRSQPIERIFTVIRSSGSQDTLNGNLLEIEDTFISMASEIQHFKHTIENLNDMVSNNLLERLFFNDFSASQALDAFVRYYGPMPQPCIVTVISRQTAPLEDTISQPVVNLLHSMEQPVYVSHFHKGKLYLLLTEHEHLRQNVEQTLKQYRENTQEILKAGISNPITSLTSVKEATSQAERRLNAGFHLQGVYLFAHTYSSQATQQQLSVQTLDSLQRTLLTGNREAADKIIGDIFQYMTPDKVDVVGLRQLFFSLRTVYSLVINQFKLEAKRTGENVFEWISLPNDLDEYSTHTVKMIFSDLNASIYQYYQKQQARAARIRGLDVMNYVDENFRNPNLCASSIAEHFGLSEKYVFQLAKGACGETLNDRISALRVQESIRLLENTSLNVAEIASKSGFTSSNSMYKVFMRVKGVAPSSFRQKNKKENLL